MDDVPNEDPYYGEFDRRTREGIVFDFDLSTREDVPVEDLLQEEKDERNNWIETREGLLTFYENRPGVVGSPEEMLQQRVPAPFLDDAEASRRTGATELRAGQDYPPRLEVWVDFLNTVTRFSASGKPMTRLESPFVTALKIPRRMTSETEELQYLLQNALDYLAVARILPAAKHGGRRVQGNPDFYIKRAGPAHGKCPYLMMGEAKSTHNLQLPMAAPAVVAKYESVYSRMTQAGTMTEAERTSAGKAWQKVVDPIAQIARYMSMNRCRFGALTSGTRTYFFHYQSNQQESTETVLVSDAWFIGQENYLRAWAAVCDMSDKDEQPLFTRPEAWVLGTPTKKRKAEQTCIGKNDEHSGGYGPHDKDRGADDQHGPKSGHSVTRPLTQLNIPEVNYFDIQVLRPLGDGRRGTAFAVKWNGKTYAMKQFDTNKGDGLAAAGREFKAYAYLKEAWGKLVPTPGFFSVEFGVIFLGLQLCEHPAQGDRCSDWDEVVEKLAREHKFRHLDLWDNRNLMMLRDGNDIRRPVVIDLEEFEILDDEA
jgi:hypothetical protein